MTDKETKDKLENSKKDEEHKEEERKTYRGIVTDISAQEEEIKKLEQEREDNIASDKET